MSFITRKAGLLVAAAVAAVTPVVLAGNGGANTVTTVQTIDATEVFPGGVVPAPCATVTISGEIHQVTHVTALPDGSTRLKFVSHPQGVTGVSETGAIYHGGGTSTVTMVMQPGSANVLAIASSFLMIGEGSAPDIRVIAVMQVTVNANGTTTSTVENAFFTCE